MARQAGLNYKINTRALLEFAKRAAMVSRITKPALAISLNNVGDGVVAQMATSLVEQTGLTLEQVRGLMKVKRANKSDLKYDVRIDQRLMNEKVDTLHGQREISDFGRRQPGELVIIVSKKDELVCMDCEELAAAGPMPIEVASQHVPKHPNCRCIIMPYVQKGKRLPVTMTSLTGTSARRRAGKRISLDQNVTIRQLAQNALNNTAGKIRIELTGKRM